MYKILFSSVVLALAVSGCSSMNHGSTGASGVGQTTTSAAMGAMPGMTHDSSTSAGDGMAGMNHGTPAEGLRVQIVTSPTKAGIEQALSFKVVDSSGGIVNQYEIEQTKELHLVIVRSDLSGYQHLHPARDNLGVWSIPLTLAKGGVFRVVADFVPVMGGMAMGRTAVVTDLSIVPSAADTPLPAESASAAVDGYLVELVGNLGGVKDAPLDFVVTGPDGKPVKLEPYLGSFGHLVAFAKADLTYTHIHPESANAASGTLKFVGHTKTTGVHRLFLQFAAAGKVHTAEFTASAA